MAKKKMKFKGGKRLFGEFKGFLKEKSERAQKATRLLVVLARLSVITGLIGFYLYTPAKQIYVAESTFIKESRNIYDYKVDTDERAKQIEKANEAETVYASVMDKYTTSDNFLIKGYANIHGDFFKVIIALAIVLPFVAIALMFIGSPVNFLFAVANIVIVAPVSAAIYLFNSFREGKNQKNSKISTKNLELEEA